LSSSACNSIAKTSSQIQHHKQKMGEPPIYLNYRALKFNKNPLEFQGC
jgi:hypothetical protein